MPTFHDAIPNDWIGPGETTAVEVDGIPVAIANVEGEFFAFGNFCPHQATPLGGQPLQRKCVIVCPEHHSMYDVRSGDVRDAVRRRLRGPPQHVRDPVVDDVVQVSSTANATRT